MLPTVTLPKFKLVGFATNAPGVTPMPDKPMLSVGFEAFEVMVTLPLALPAEVGANVTVKLVLCPAASVIGAMMPLKVKPVPLRLT